MLFFIFMSFMFYILYLYIVSLISLDTLHLKPVSWNELEEQEEFSNNIPDRKLGHMEKANLLRYIYVVKN